MYEFFRSILNDEAVTFWQPGRKNETAAAFKVERENSKKKLANKNKKLTLASVTLGEPGKTFCDNSTTDKRNNTTYWYVFMRNNSKNRPSAPPECKVV